MKDFISVGRNFRIYYTTLLLSTIADASSSQS
jgi:hypothetical protein